MSFVTIKDNTCVACGEPLPIVAGPYCRGCWDKIERGEIRDIFASFAPEKPKEGTEEGSTAYLVGLTKSCLAPNCFKEIDRWPDSFCPDCQPRADAGIVPNPFHAGVDWSRLAFTGKERVDQFHDLKTWPAEFRAIAQGSKRFDLRQDDRGFRVGDILILREYHPESKHRYTGRDIFGLVTYILPGGKWGLPEGFCVMSLSPLPLRAEAKP